MNNITIFSRLIQSANSSLRTTGYTMAKIASQSTTTYNSQNDKTPDNAVSYNIICGQTICGNSYYEQCTTEDKIRN